MTDEARDVIARQLLDEPNDWDRRNALVLGARTELRGRAGAILAALTAAGFHLHRWQDISEAPKDGTAVILLQPWMSGRESMVIGHYANGWVNQLCLYCSHDQEKEFGGEVGNEVMHCDPTHFAPLPPAPPEPAP